MPQISTAEANGELVEAKTVQINYAEEFLKCDIDRGAEGCWYFLTNYWKTEDVDTGEIKNFANFTAQYDKPEYRERIKDLIKELEYRYANRLDIILEKSRQTYGTNTIIGWIAWHWIFDKLFKAGLTSEKESKVDKHGDNNTLFGRFDFGIDHLPLFLTPEKKYLEKSHMLRAYKFRNNAIVGDAGPNPGRYGAVNVTFADEMAHQTGTYQKFRSIRGATKNSIIFLSNAGATNNIFYDTRTLCMKSPKDTTFKLLTMHLSERKTAEGVEAEKRKYGADTDGFEQEINIKWGTTVKGRCFKQFISAKHTIALDPIEFKKQIHNATIISGWDIGFVHVTANIWMTMLNGKWVIFDEYEAKETPIHVHKRAYFDRVTGWDVNNSQVVNVADPSSAARSKQTGKTEFELYEVNDLENGVESIKFKQADNSVKLGIETVNTMFYSDKLLVSTNCPRLIDALNEAEYYTNENGEKIQEKYREDKNTDILDAARYAIMEASKGVQLKTKQKTVATSLSLSYFRR